MRVFVGVYLTGSQYAAIVTAVSWTDVIAGIVAIGALVMSVLVVMRGVKFLFRIVGR